MKFKLRESTDFLFVHLKDTGGLSMPELHRAARKVGKLDPGFHYVVQDNGIVDEGREQYAVAGYDLEESNRSIHVLVDVGEDGKISDAQSVALKNLMSSIEGTYPNIKKIMC